MFALIDRWLNPEISKHLLRRHDEVLIMPPVRRHWVVFVRPAVQAWVGLALMGYGMFGVQVDLVTIVGLGLLLWAVYIALRERREVFVVTNLRVFRLTGVFDTRRASVPLTRILDVTLDRPVLGRLLGYGHLTFESAAQEQGLREIRFVMEADDREHRIQEAVADMVYKAPVRGPQ